MITKGPEKVLQHIKPTWFTASARLAWKHLLENHAKGQDKQVLLPAYIGFTDREGSGVFDPVLNTGVQYSFYSINRKFEPDIPYIEKQVRSGKVSVVLIIHYFGFCTADIAHIKRVSSAHGVVVVEDCAHAYTFGRPQFTLGHTGDYAFYSLHKFFATTSGGVLVANPSGDVLRAIDPKDACEQSVLEHVLSADVETMIAERRNNFRFLSERFSNHAHIKPVHRLSEETVPQSFPVFVEGVKRADLYFRLMEKDCPTIALYYRLIDQINKEDFPESYWISDRILNLPVHHGTSLSDLEFLCEQIDICLTELTT
jgi:dTDP-4-amino-4,6-dideoxygalactose transaminase